MAFPADMTWWSHIRSFRQRSISETASSNCGRPEVAPLSLVALTNPLASGVICNPKVIRRRRASDSVSIRFPKRKSAISSTIFGSRLISFFDVSRASLTMNVPIELLSSDAGVVQRAFGGVRKRVEACHSPSAFSSLVSANYLNSNQRI